MEGNPVLVTQLSGFISGIVDLTMIGCLAAKHAAVIFVKLLIIFLFLSILFFARPKKSIQKKHISAPGVPLFPALLKTGGALSNSAPKEQGPQTAKGPFSARFCDARRGTDGIIAPLAFFSPSLGLSPEGREFAQRRPSRP
jgi:hypothetical protein